MSGRNEGQALCEIFQFSEKDLKSRLLKYVSAYLKTKQQLPTANVSQSLGSILPEEYQFAISALDGRWLISLGFLSVCRV